MAQQRQAAGQCANAKDLYGEVWLFTLIATGRVHAESVRIVNEIYEERIREQAVPGRALASSQGQSREVVGKTGDMVHPVAPPHVGVVERSLQILQQRIDRGVVTWPPP